MIGERNLAVMFALLIAAVIVRDAYRTWRRARLGEGAQRREPHLPRALSPSGRAAGMVRRENRRRVAVSPAETPVAVRSADEVLSILDRHYPVEVYTEE